MRRLPQWFLKSFLKGLLLVVPLMVTVWVLYGVFHWIDGLLNSGLMRKIGGLIFSPWSYARVVSIPGVGFLITLFTIVAVGALGSNLVADRFIAYLERFLNRLPLVKLIYFSLKDLIGAFVGEKKSFRFPVLVSLYNEGGAKVLGFVTAEDVEFQGVRDHVAVYLPQSYNYSGFLIVVPRANITPLPSSESAKWLSFIVSGGVSRGPHGPDSHGGGASPFPKI